jgi:microcystin-dependent protein
MARDSNGVYSLPSGYLAVTGETIQASQHNPPLEDIRDALTGSLPRSGSAPMSAPLKAADGTVATPSLTFANAAGSGLFKTAAGIGVSVNGTQVGEFGSGGLIGALGPIGSFIFGTFSAALPKTVMPFGQTLSRALYPDLWTHAQASIAVGFTFYNNGDGSTTFGIGDVRGRSFFVKDDQGSSAANRITFGLSGIAGNLIGAAGGTQNQSLSTAHLPPHTHSGTTGGMNANNPHSHTYDRAFPAASGGIWPGGGGGTVGNSATATVTTDIQHGHSFTTDNGPGTSAGLNIMPPAMIVGCLLVAGGL